MYTDRLNLSLASVTAMTNLYSRILIIETSSTRLFVSHCPYELELRRHLLLTTSMSVLLTDGLKCTLAASHAAAGESR